MPESDPGVLSNLGITTDADTDTHGREPQQADLGPHPATELVGIIQNPNNPESLTVHERGVGRPQLGSQWITADIEDTVSLEVVR